MLKKVRKILSLLLTFTVCVGAVAVSGTHIRAEEGGTQSESMPFDVEAKSAVLMDMNTGTVLYSKNPDEPLPPASVTKVMTLLLVMEAVDSGQLSLDDELTVSEHAASMGGSQVYLEPGESMKAEELLKCIVVASANDAALTMAEAVAGSEEAFVARMNERAAELGMKNTNFENVTGLDDNVTNHVISARDIALMSRELMKHEKIFEFTTIWMDTIRDGAFGLTNTNRLIRFYKGATGLKTGSTSKAGFCISATAKRDNLHLIAVIMGAETRDKRNEAAKQLLDWGFANYAVYSSDGGECEPLPVIGGTLDSVGAYYGGCELLLPKNKVGSVSTEVSLPDCLTAPVHAGERIGEVKYMVDGEVKASSDILAAGDVEKISFGRLFMRFIGGFLLK